MRFPELAERAETLAREFDLSPQAVRWVALAALHAGCFLRSQYRAFSGHSREAARLFVGSLIRKRIAEEQPLEEQGLLCRLTSKALYRALGIPEIRHHRRASHPVLYRRLLALDYVLDHPHLLWLHTEAEKLACFDALNIPRLELPFRIYEGVAGRARRYFNPKQPIAVSTYSKTAVFVYIGGEEQSPQGLRSWQLEHEKLWRRLYQQGYRLSIVHAGRNRKRSRGAHNAFQHRRKTTASAAQIAALRHERQRLEEALWETVDEAVFDEYGGYNKARRRAEKLERILEEKTTVIGYEMSYEVWLSERIRSVG